ncbi:hypothetical protein LWP59_16755 [Amycolatopsis acidiphila]|uniref:Uncharacterized protein n=1 Tax=Amycolatopsis acidiphila TaxID=715473 RepID=A0A558AB36_9PSEU|nr:hypothetical protein [Amycolatopsis acidiphila]TVT21476.1 hypothetical protein FNH06_17035 [Amycolatopsis acidiphila]UIJ63157.1 hypothetical protein LWP59_16755 [Amycolatopsis acidiphila]
MPRETQVMLDADGSDVVFAGALFLCRSGCMAADIVCVGIPGDEARAGKLRGALLRPSDGEIVRD